MYIVSNSSYNSYIESFLNNGNMKDYFKDYIAAGRLSLLKGEAISKIIKDNDIKDAIYVGDTYKDMISAKEAKIPFIQCLYGFSEDLDCNYKIKNIYDLREIIDKIYN